MSINAQRYEEIVAYAADNLQSTADVLTYTPTAPGKVIRYGFIMTEDASSTDPFVVTLDLRPTTKSDTNRVEKAALTVASGDSAGADAGNLYYEDVNVDVAVGQEVVVEVQGAVAAGAGVIFIHFIREPFQPNPGGTGWPALAADVVKATA